MATKSKIREEHGGVEAWNELFEYVEHEILLLSQDMRMPSKYILRLEGLSKGNFMANKNIKPMAKYQYQDILLTFKLVKTLMKFKTDFKDDEHRFNYAMSIAEKKINDVVKARERKGKSDKKIQNIDLSSQVNERAEYKPKSSNNTNKLLDELW